MTATTERLPVNPLLDFSGLPHFDEIRPEHVGPAIDSLIGDAHAERNGATAAAG